MVAETPAPVIVGADGRPARGPDKRCPQCKAGPDRRVASSGFGVPHPVCGCCGYEWHDERMES
jgi:transposase-like protein